LPPGGIYQDASIKAVAAGFSGLRLREVCVEVRSLKGLNPCFYVMKAENACKQGFSFIETLFSRALSVMMRIADSIILETRHG
jgi:hypothetical protein